MCGIVAYTGSRQAGSVLLDGLRRLEYRGYDSAGVALVHDEQIALYKEVGRVAELARHDIEGRAGQTGIAHTRWATHGGVTQPNAHPHLDASGRIAVVHNGIVDNAGVIRTRLEAEGVRFQSETDTEVLPHLIAAFYEGDPVHAVRQALGQVRGTYGIAVSFADHPDTIVAARNGSPLVVGLGEGENFLASDPHAVVKYTQRVIYLDDRELAVLTPAGVETVKLDGEFTEYVEQQLEGLYGDEGKGSYPHYMLKEIFEQPESIARCLSGRVQDTGTARLGGFELSPRDLTRITRVTILGCGTSLHASRVGAMAVESLARIPAVAEVASEYHHRNPLIDPDGLYLAVSQSGETFDTLAAVREVQVKGGLVMGVVNVVGSTIARTCGAGVYLHSGPEIAVASTKAFTSQVAALYVFTLMLARTRNLSADQAQELAEALIGVPTRVEQAIARLSEDLARGPIGQAAGYLTKARYALFMGRGPSWPVALEGALKLKEIAYVPCEAYAAGEMKHGPIAMMEEGTPVVVVVPDDGHRDRTLSNIREVAARGARIIAVHTEGDDEIASLADVSLPVPPVHHVISPLVTVLPLQLLAYQAALALGRDIDRPRNLAKSVTVE